MSRFIFPKLLPAVLLVASPLIASAVGKRAAEPQYAPVKWTNFVKVDGQIEPVPEQWLQDAEAKIAHSLKLPDSVPKPVPFSFAKALAKSLLPGTPSETLQYFNHLCSTEAGQWVFKKVQNVEGFYFARPQGAPTSDTLTDPYGPEMPWMQRMYVLRGDSKPLDQAGWLIQPPINNYRFVEQPRRETKWQAHIKEPYVRLFGYTRKAIPIPGVYQVAPDPKYWYEWREKDPMQVIGIPTLTARYGYTWRGIKRVQDRERGIAGGELLIYDLQTKEVMAVRRQFLIASHNRRGEGKAMWELAASCRQRPSDGLSTDFTQFAFDVLETIEPSKTGKQP